MGSEDWCGLRPHLTTGDPRRGGYRMALSRWRCKNVPIIVLILVMVIRCTGTMPGSADITSTAIGRTPTNQVDKTEKPRILTPLVASTITPTQRASTVTPTVTRTLSPPHLLQWTPGAKLPPDEVEKKIMSLYSNNGGCELPCWWGITPGKTTGAESLSLLAPFGDTFI